MTSPIQGATRVLFKDPTTLPKKGWVDTAKTVGKVAEDDFLVYESDEENRGKPEPITLSSPVRVILGELDAQTLIAQNRLASETPKRALTPSKLSVEPADKKSRASGA